jgi:hypothetical protein
LLRTRSEFYEPSRTFVGVRVISDRIFQQGQHLWDSDTSSPDNRAKLLGQIIVRLVTVKSSELLCEGRRFSATCVEARTECSALREAGPPPP